MIKAGVPPKHILFGVSAYGRGWADVKADADNNPFSTATTAKADSLAAGTPFPKEDGMWEPGIMDYKWIVSKIAPAANAKSTFKYYWDAIAKSPYYWSQQEGRLIVFDDPCSVQVKMDFAKQYGLAGTFSWEIDGDNGDLMNVMRGSKPTGCAR